MCKPSPPPIATGHGDILAFIDPKSMRMNPCTKTQHYLVDFRAADGEPLHCCPRSLLKSVLKRLGTTTAMVGMEYEFYNFLETAESLQTKKGVNLSPLTSG
jgi:glutamine synthetase